MADEMTGGGRCQRRMKFTPGAAVPAKVESYSETPVLNPQITEKPSGSFKITKLPPESAVEFGLYTQAHKALSFRSPFDSEEGPPASLSGANSLPSGVSRLFNSHSDSRKRLKKLHLGSEQKSSAQLKAHGNNIWVETDEYFRELTLEDVERLEKFSSFGFSSNEKCLSIPCLIGDGNFRVHYDEFNRLPESTCEKYNMDLENGLETKSNGKLGFSERMAPEENGLRLMDVDGDEVVSPDFQIKEESNGGRILNNVNNSASFSGVEWLLGCRSKIYLASEWPSKKRKLLGSDAGLEMLLVACPVEGLQSVCHYCSREDMGNPLNLLINCSSCGMVVHQRCYGVLDDVESSWSCSWCKWKNVVDLSTETSFMICPKQGVALKPVLRRGVGRDNELSKVQFAHLVCFQWMSDVYIENTKTMESIVNMDMLKDTKRELVCYLCKVECGACVRCSNGSCRTSFHPICVREARHRLEIWGKIGSSEVELCAFCTKHSEDYCYNGSQQTGDLSMTVDLEGRKLNDIVLDADDLLDNRRNNESHQENGDELHPVDKYSAHRNAKEDVNACGVIKLAIILKKDNNMAPEFQCKLLRWLKNCARSTNLQKIMIMKIRSLVQPKDVNLADGIDAVPVEESNASDSVQVKSVPPRRTKSSIYIKDDKSCSFKDSDDETTEGHVDSYVLVGEDSNDPSEDFPDGTKKILIDFEQHQDDSVNSSSKIEDELSVLVHFFSEDGLGEETKHSQPMNRCLPVLLNGEFSRDLYEHPFIHSKLMPTKKGMLDKSASYQSVVLRDQEASLLKASLQWTPDDLTSRRIGVKLEQLVEARNIGILKLSPADEVEGELLYYQQLILKNAIERKHISDDLISKVVPSLVQEMDAAGNRKWDDVLVCHYLDELKEAKKQGRKERRHKEAQAVLAAATAAAAVSTRSTIKKDTPEESSHQKDARRGVYSQHNPRIKETISKLGVSRSSFDTTPDSVQSASDFSKDHPRTCDVCRRSETVLNPVLSCSSCKLAVHLDCYRSVKSTSGPWQCELCEDLFSSRASVALDKPYFVAECGLCGGTAGAFRKSVDGQWIHALCAEWVLESTYIRGQINPIVGMDSVSKGVDACNVCNRKHGVCLKCSFGHCQTRFHPSCARSAGFYMTVRTNGGKLQHKAYCERHSTDQRAKADTQKHGIEEFKSLKQVRVELERLRLLCERIIKREKLKRELVICSHDFLASRRDSVLSALARHPFYQPEVSSESSTTSLKGNTEMLQMSDDGTVDSTIATKKRRVKHPVSMDNDRNTVDISTSQNLYTLKPVERVSLSGKQVPKRLSAASHNPSNESKHRKHAETFDKELLMTSDQASMKNQRLPKGFVYVPIRSLSEDKDNASDPRPRESVEHNG